MLFPIGLLSQFVVLRGKELPHCPGSRPKQKTLQQTKKRPDVANVGRCGRNLASANSSPLIWCLQALSYEFSVYRQIELPMTGRT